MTLEELQAAFEEQKAANDALIAKNRELLGELKAARKNTSVDPDEFERVRGELETTREALERAQKGSKAEVEKLTRSLADANTAVQRYIVDGGLADALAKAGVAPQFMDAAKALWRGQAAIRAEGESLVAVIGEKPMAEFVAEWAATEQGKHFVLAPRNVGGGAPGGNGNGINGKPFAEMTSEERVHLYRSNPTEYDARKRAAAPN
jgi:hypothetical protein